MNPRWREFLINRGARIAGDRVTGFGDSREQQLSGTGEALLADLSYLQPVAVTGGDAVSFLHAQLTSNVQGQAPGRVQFSAWCDAKGRVQAVLLLARLPERLVMLVPAALQPGFLERLQRYRLRADVQFHDRAGDWGLLGLSGPPRQLPPDLQVTVGHAGEHSGLLMLHVPDPIGNRLIMVGEPGMLSRRWEALASLARPTSTGAWRLLDCAGAIPWLDETGSGQYLPQELGLDRLAAVSFSKGCFPGQEIIARVHYRGQVKRRLVRIAIATASPPDPGTVLIRNGALAGRVLAAQQQAPNRALGLAVVGVECRAGEQLQLGDAGGAPVEVQAMPQAPRA